MKVNIDYLKNFIQVPDVDMKELFSSLGMEVAEKTVYGNADILEIEITPNRPDWLSYIGIARELKAKFPRLELKMPEIIPVFDVQNVDSFAIKIEDKNDCSRYCGCIVRQVEIKDSSPAYQDIILSAGANPISNIVDISNIVWQITGQPIHIFDLDQLQGNIIQVRRARRGEKLLLLDDRTIDVDENILVIADGRKPLALAGIMGGKESGVTSVTRNILIESACFNPVLIRKSARMLGLQTDASYRFERGTDVGGTRFAIELALKLIADDQQKTPQITYYYDLFPKPYQSPTITLAKNYASDYTGIDIGPGIVQEILTYLGFTLIDKGQSWEVAVPSFRIDISGKQDLVEEVIRLYGYDKLTSALPTTINQGLPDNSYREFHRSLQHNLSLMGFSQVINYSFHGPQDNTYFDDELTQIEIKNPIGREYSMLRTTLVPGLLRNLALNLNQFCPGVFLFETGYVFSKKEGGISQQENLAMAATGLVQEKNWLNQKEKVVDYHLFKSFISTWASRHKIDLDFVEKERVGFNSGSALALFAHDLNVGFMGEIRGDVLDFFGVNKPVFAMEINLSLIIPRLRDYSFHLWNKFPVSRRDLTFLIDQSIRFAQVESIIRKRRPLELETYTLVDFYQGENIPADMVSLSMSFIYRGKDKTLTNEEVNHSHKQIVEELIDQLHIIPR